MRIRITAVLVSVCALMLAMLSAGPAMAQSASAEKAPLYTYVSEWSIPRAMWADYQKLENSDNDMLGKAVADGTLVSFGTYQVLNHQEGSPTHGSWFSAHSMANLMKVLEALRSAPDAVAAPLAASRHWDYILQSTQYNAHSGSFKNAYLRVGYWPGNPGASDPGGAILKAGIVGLLEKLLADGALHAYQIDEQSIHTQELGGIYIAIITNGAEGLDKFNAAIQDAQKNNPVAYAAFRTLVQPKGHTDFLARVGAMAHK